jgi:hypothetical protein
MLLCFFGADHVRLLDFIHVYCLKVCKLGVSKSQAWARTIASRAPFAAALAVWLRREMFSKGIRRKLLSWLDRTGSMAAAMSGNEP